MFGTRLSLWARRRAFPGVRYAITAGNDVQQSGKTTREMFALNNVDWWRRDEPEKLTVIALRDGRKLLIKDTGSNLAQLLAKHHPIHAERIEPS